MKEKADLLIIHSRIYAVDNGNHVYEAMSVAGGKILELGSSAALLAKYSPERIVDLKGNVVFPGFIDAHCHFLGLALNLQYADLKGSASFDEVLKRLSDAEKLSQGEWIVGRGWDQNLWEKKEFPDRAELDILFPERPVMLIRIDGHSVLANGEALRKAGITGSGHFSPGEIGVRNGWLTGILSENASDLMRNTVPLPDDTGKALLLKRAQELCFSNGLCAVSDAGLDFSEVRLIDSLQKTGTLKMRVYAMLNPTAENLSGFTRKGPYLTDRLFVRSLKMYSDGSLGSRTALLKQPYSDDPGNRGILVTPLDSIREICRIAAGSGYQVNTHCIGDSAVKVVLEIYGSFLEGSNDLRWRIEHAQVVDPADLPLFGRFSVIPSVQGTHATSDMYWAEKRLGSHRIGGAYAYKALMEQNGWIANGTDFPIEGISPVLTFYASVVRKDLKGWPEDGFQPENALSREDALRSITIWAAKAGFMEQYCGSLEPGKNADFVVTDRDLMKVTPDEIPGTAILQTYIAGERVH